MNQGQLIKLQMIEQEAEQLNKQSELIDQNISELKELKESFDEIEKMEDNKNKILINLGKRIFIPVEIKDKNLFVDVGNKHFIRKTIPETRKTLEEQLKKLGSAKFQIMERLEELQKNMENLIKEAEKDKKSQSKIIY